MLDWPCAGDGTCICSAIKELHSAELDSHLQLNVDPANLSFIVAYELSWLEDDL